MHISLKKLQDFAKLVRYFIIRSTTKAGSGHLTSSLSATDLMTVLMFGGFFHANLKKPHDPLNDRLIFSKGHASPLFYSLYAAAGAIGEDELMTLRQFGSRLEGHPTMHFPFTEAATGSLGQGLSVGAGMAMNAMYLDALPYKTFVLLGDSEMAEGSNWEAMELAAYYKLHNLIAIVDVNRLGQRGETMSGHRLAQYERKAWAFGWKTIVIDGHNYREIEQAYKRALKETKQPVMILAKTLKGKGVALVEDKEGWHGKPLSEAEAKQALSDLGSVNTGLRGMVPHRELNARQQEAHTKAKQHHHHIDKPVTYTVDQMVATRQAYGPALIRIFSHSKNVVVLDAETSNSTGAGVFKKECPQYFFEMFIAEQNMVGTALGLSRRGKIPFVSTFAAFFSRAHDQIRMAQYSHGNIKFVGSHCGVSIGEDGASQMGLEDIALFRSVLGSVVLYPADASATNQLVERAAEHFGIVYLRTTRQETPVLYGSQEKFVIGGSKVLQASNHDAVTVVAAGITVHEALKAYRLLQQSGIAIRVIDLYSVKPLDSVTLEKALRETKALVVVEDHYAEGGIGEAVRSALPTATKPIYHLAVRRQPQSGTSAELLAFEQIDAAAIVDHVKKIVAG